MQRSIASRWQPSLSRVLVQKALQEPPQLHFLVNGAVIGTAPMNADLVLADRRLCMMSTFALLFSLRGQQFQISRSTSGSSLSALAERDVDYQRSLTSLGRFGKPRGNRQRSRFPGWS